jgi:hypothetical protein
MLMSEEITGGTKGLRESGRGGELIKNTVYTSTEVSEMKSPYIISVY